MEQRQSCKFIIAIKKNHAHFENGNCREEVSKVRQMRNRELTSVGLRKQRGRGRNMLHHIIKTIHIFFFMRVERDQKSNDLTIHHASKTTNRNTKKAPKIQTSTYTQMESSKIKING